MGGVSGVEIIAAFKKTVTWGTAIVLGANDGLLILPTSIKRDAEIDIDDSLGEYFSVDGAPSLITCEGDIPGYLRYDGWDIIIALAMGIAGAPAQQAATAAYAYTYKWKKDTDGLFGVFAKDMKNYIDENPSVKIAGFTIKGEIGQAVQIIAHTICDNKLSDSAVNTPATFNNVTILEDANRIRFSQGAFRMNDQGDAALDAGDVIYPSSFELIAMRKLVGVHDGQYKTAGGNPQELIDEPTNDGMPEISLKLGFPRHTANTNLLALVADTRKKMDMVFTGNEIETPYNRELTIEMPHLQMKNVDPVDEQGIIKEPLEFIVHSASAAPTGMTVTDPFWISGINQRTTDPLA